MDEGVLSQRDAIYDGILGFLMLSTNLTIFVFIQIHRTLRKEKVSLPSRYNCYIKISRA